MDDPRDETLMEHNEYEKLKPKQHRMGDEYEYVDWSEAEDNYFREDDYGRRGYY